MKRSGSELFVEVPSRTPNQWLRGTVVSGSGRTVTVQLEHSADLDSSDVIPGHEIRIHARRADALASQMAHVIAVSLTTPGEITFEPLGEPEPFDRRGSARTTLASATLCADFEDEVGCEVLELNSSGFALVATDKHVPGAIGALTVHFEGETLSGYGAVRSSQPFRDGRTLYGVQVLEMAGTRLHTAMPRIHASLSGSEHDGASIG